MKKFCVLWLIAWLSVSVYQVYRLNQLIDTTVVVGDLTYGFEESQIRCQLAENGQTVDCWVEWDPQSWFFPVVGTWNRIALFGKLVGGAKVGHLGAYNLQLEDASLFAPPFNWLIAALFGTLFAGLAACKLICYAWGIWQKTAGKDHQESRKGSGDDS